MKSQTQNDIDLPESKSLTDELMDCVDRLGSESDDVDPRVWDHLLVYVPTDKLFACINNRKNHDD